MVTKKYPLEMGVHESGHHRVSNMNKLWAFFSFIISVADVAVILVLTYLHFIHEHDIIAWLMLLPILLNFIGIFAFLSNEDERREFEELAGSSRASGLVKNLMILPVFGPAFSSLRLFIYALQDRTTEQFERLESLLTKMKQYESFFRASPEAFVQMIYRIVSWSSEKPFKDEDYWTSACIFLCIFSLAESNMYGIVRPYYRMFSDPSKLPENAWSTETIAIPWRILLFIYTDFSMASRLLSDAILRATMCFVFAKYQHLSVGVVIAITLITKFGLRVLAHIILIRPRENLTLTKDQSRIIKLNPGYYNSKQMEFESGPLIYRAFTYSWRSIFMSFDFQNPDNVICSWFFVENGIMIASAYGFIYQIEIDLREKTVYLLYTGMAVVFMLTAISIKLGVYYFWVRPNLKRAMEQEAMEESSKAVVLEVNS